MELLDYAIRAAAQAGKLIEDASLGPVDVERKVGGDSLASQVLTKVDRQAQEIILQVLEPTFKAFDLGLLTEESEDDRSRFDKDFFWCIDPLDGTLPFIEGTAGYSVSIALVSRSGDPHIGVIYDPVGHTLYYAKKGEGAFRNGAPFSITPQPNQPLKLITDRSFAERPDYPSILSELKKIAAELGLPGVETKAVGGAAMNACWVLESAPACYFKMPKPSDGGGSLWDYAATACLFAEAGAIATDFSGASLDLNRADSTFMNHRGILFATDLVLAARIQQIK